MPRPVAEWRGKTDADRIPDRVRLRVLDRWFGLCAWCGRAITRDLEVDHIIALINGGAHREANLMPLHRVCHRHKTARDVAEKAVTARKRRRHLLRKPRTITAWRRFDGSIVRRPRER